LSRARAITVISITMQRSACETLPERTFAR
jgi:hypothetical protein